jgi:hypothetical protein
MVSGIQVPKYDEAMKGKLFILAKQEQSSRDGLANCLATLVAAKSASTH